MQPNPSIITFAVILETTSRIHGPKNRKERDHVLKRELMLGQSTAGAGREFHNLAELTKKKNYKKKQF